MSIESAVFLMYHELEVPPRRLDRAEPGYLRYVVRAADFQRQMQFLRDTGLRGSSVSEVLHGSTPRALAITFDDGSESDLFAAAALLADLSFGATFYVTRGFLGTRGHLSNAQLRELSAAGFEIGCHSESHPYLTDLSVAALEREMVQPKRALEQLLGRAVHHFSCPGGRWNPQVASVARQGGYLSVATSRPVVNTRSTDPFRLGRVAVLRQTDLAAFGRLSRGAGLWRRRLPELALAGMKRLVGNSAYDRLRRLVLGRSGDQGAPP